MKKTTIAASGLLLAITASATGAHAWEEKPLRITEHRIAGARVGQEGDRLRGLIRIRMGQQTIGVPPQVSALREACVEVLDFSQRFIDSACASANVFVDDLFLYGEGSGSIPSVVVNEWGQKVADSVLTFEGVWTRDFMDACEAPSDGPFPVVLAYNSYYSAPVFPAAENEAERWCIAEASVTIESEFLGSPAGTNGAVLGIGGSAKWRGPKQNFPDTPRLP